LRPFTLAEVNQDVRKIPPSMKKPADDCGVVGGHRASCSRQRKQACSKLRRLPSERGIVFLNLAHAEAFIRGPVGTATLAVAPSASHCEVAGTILAAVATLTEVLDRRGFWSLLFTAMKAQYDEPITVTASAALVLKK